MLRRSALSHTTVLRSALAVLVLTVVGSLPLATPGHALASGPANVLGTWTVDPSSPTSCCSTIFATEDFATGAVKGTADGGTFVVEGTVTGNSINFTTSETGYVAHDKANISADDTQMSGNFTDSNGSSGTFILDHQLISLSGTLRITECTDEVCKRAGVPNEEVTVASSGGNSTKVTATSGSDGAWSAKVLAGTYVVTPPDGFVPDSKTVDAKADVTGIDFATCGSLGVASKTHAQPAERLHSGVRRHTASGQTGCPNAIDWNMARTDEVPGIAENTSLGMLTQKDVYAPFDVHLNLSVEGTPVKTCAKNSVWKWSVTKKPAGSHVLEGPETPGCSSRMVVDTQGDYTVLAKHFVNGKLEQKINNPVVVHDLLVVAMGDSNGSGEGLPPFWMDQCNRGSASYQYQAAQLLEGQSKNHTSVTFVSASCSGATIANLIDTPYEGVRPGPSLPGQIHQIDHAVQPPAGETRRKIDAAVISIGVNDLAFGPILKYCVFVQGCQNTPVRTLPAEGPITKFVHDRESKRTLGQIIDGLVAQLPDKYDDLASALESSGLVPPSKVYITQYPSFFFANGHTCSSGANMTASTWAWLAGESHKLNAAVVKAAGAHGWNSVSVPISYFLNHGYCANDPWFVSILQANSKSNGAGAFHPTKRGAHVTAVFLLEQMCPLLGVKDDCLRFPLP